jgi:hypothetical protein
MRVVLLRRGPDAATILSVDVLWCSTLSSVPVEESDIEDVRPLNGKMSSVVLTNRVYYYCMDG